MSKLALLAFALLFALSALVVPNLCHLNERGHGQADSVTSSDFYSTMALIACLIALYFLSKLLASDPEPNVCVYGHNSSHHWLFSDMVFASIPLHCSICHSLLLTAKGRFCSSCGISCCTESACWRKANSTQMCKEIALLDEQTLQNKRSKSSQRGSTQKQEQLSINRSETEKQDETSKPEMETKDLDSISDAGIDDQTLKTEKPSIEREGPLPKFRHHWIAGNLPLSCECEVCEEPCGDSPGIVDLRCCWCQRTVHNSCQPRLSDVCDLGEFRQFIIPPFCVVAKSGRTVRHPLRKVVSQVVNSRDFLPAEEWTPLIVIGNRKSGSKDTSTILANFRTQLNPAQVIDLDECTMEDGLKWCQLISDSAKNIYCLIAGGDGTISWVLNTVDKMNLTNPPAIALFPIGTGNDLARSLGYGSGSDASENVRDIMKRIQTAKQTMLDRWRVELKQSHWRFGMLTQSPKEMFMQNYLSIGVDALVTYNFSKARESPFYLIPSRIINKFIYFIYGTKDVLERACKDLDAVIEVFMDGKKVDLPNIESVVVLNIPNWGAGVKPWTLGSGHLNYPRNSFNDKKLEVFCVYSSFHIAQMQVGLSEPHRLGQASEVKICIYAKVPIQIDGEPWVQHPAEITITHHKQVPVLALGSASDAYQPLFS